jgi:hypothetical protein
MNISEQDIFNYIFSRQNLSEEKIKYIENTKYFREEIRFYSSMKEMLYKQFPSEKKIHRLKPVLLNFRKYNSSQPRFAAASADLTRKTEFTTFTDEASGYLCRFLKTGDRNLLYIISSDEQTDKRIDITIFPSEARFHLEHIRDPIELPGTDVELIHIEEV